MKIKKRYIAIAPIVFIILLFAMFGEVKEKDEKVVDTAAEEVTEVQEEEEEVIEAEEENDVEKEEVKNEGNEENNEKEATKEKVVKEEKFLSDKLKETNDIELNEISQKYSKWFLIKIGSWANDGEINGSFNKYSGDGFKITDENDKVINSLKEIKKGSFRKDRIAEVYDSDGNVSGYIGIDDKATKNKEIVCFYDKDKKQIGYTRLWREEQKKNYYEVYGDRIKEDYDIYETINKDGTFDYDIRCKNNESVVSKTDVLLGCVIMNSIKTLDKK